MFAGDDEDQEFVIPQYKREHLVKKENVVLDSSDSEEEPQNLDSHIVKKVFVKSPELMPAMSEDSTPAPFEVKNKPSEEIKKEIKNEIKNEIKDEIKNEIKSEIQGEPESAGTAQVVRFAPTNSFLTSVLYAPIDFLSSTAAAILYPTVLLSSLIHPGRMRLLRRGLGPSTSANSPQTLFGGFQRTRERISVETTGNDEPDDLNELDEGIYQS